MGRTGGATATCGRLLVALAIALLAGAGWGASAAGASASVIGDTNLTNGEIHLQNIGASGVPVFQGVADASYIVSSPVSGTINSWSFRTGGAAPGTTFALRVLRQAPGGGDVWTAVATSSIEAVPSAATADQVVGPFPTDLAIESGDRIALEPVSGTDTPIVTAPGSAIRFFATAFPDGASEAIDPASAGVGNQVVPIQATVTPSTPPPAAAPPQNLTPPRIEGTAAAGNTLTCDPGVWSGNPTSFTYTWIAGDPSMPSFTVPLGHTQSITLEDPETYAVVECTVDATNAAGTTGAGASNPPHVAPSPPALATNLTFIVPPNRRVSLKPEPTITSGVGILGTNYCTPGHWVHFPQSYAYRWYRSLRGHFPAPDNRLVAQGPVLKIPPKVDGYWLACRVTATNAAGSHFAFSNSYFIGKSRLLLDKGATIKVSITTGFGGSRLNPKTSQRHPIRSLSLSLRCLRPAKVARRVRISYAWAINSRLSGGHDPFNQVFPGQTLSLRTLAGGVRIDRTNVPALLRLDGTVRCIATARRGRTATVITGNPIHVVGAR